ncbi:MAG TPA: hypothetical protein VKA21_13140 [Candidatus Binatia bacterium]|nr:hypothetical protein [Candidatus Binatia bacterium]
MATRKTKPIRLKALAAQPTVEIGEMVAELEGKSPARRSRSRRSAIWTREFLASGKIGKVGGS